MEQLLSKIDLTKPEYSSPYSYSNYGFFTENSVDIKDSWIQYAESEINRAEYQLKLIDELKSVDIGMKIELSIFEYALIYCQNNKYPINFIKPVYDDKFNSLMTNLVQTPGIDNHTFKEFILQKKINPCYIAFLSPAQIHPQKWNTIIRKKEYMEERENNMAFSDQYRCRKCGESKCKITQAQTRSADEPMTTFVFCLVCHNTMKFC